MLKFLRKFIPNSIYSYNSTKITSTEMEKTDTDNFSAFADLLEVQERQEKDALTEKIELLRPLPFFEDDEPTATPSPTFSIERFERNLKRKEARAAAEKAKLDALFAEVKVPTGSISNRGTQQGNSNLYPPIKAVLTVDPHMALQTLQELDDAFLAAIDDQVVKAEGLPSLTQVQREAVMAGFDFMFKVFEHERFKRKYGFNTSDNRQPKLAAGSPVPGYFANVGGESIYRRKVLSMAGLRNLVLYGPTIYTQMRDKLFSGRPNDYDGSSGPHLMKTMTGNVVDLDETVLRCSDRGTLEGINAMNAHRRKAAKAAKGFEGFTDEPLHPEYRDTHTFSSSPQAAAIAATAAQTAIDHFVEIMGIGKNNTAVKASRNLIIDQSMIPKYVLKSTTGAEPTFTTTFTPVPVANNNADRGNAALWHYVNCGMDSFHANVPHMADVNGALLKAPFRCAEYWFQLLALHGPYAGSSSLLCDPEVGYTGDSATDAFNERLDAFFEDCIADSCFNQKWKAIEAYGQSLAHEGTIVDVLQRLQASNQKLFDYGDDITDEEALMCKDVEVMWSLTNGRVGKAVVVGEADKKKITTRLITKADVEAWVRNPGVVI